MPGKGKKTEGEAPRGRSLADAVSEALDEKLRATAAKGELQVAGGTVESDSGGAPLSDGVSPPTHPAATLTLGRTEPELLVEELMARMEEQASRAAAERLELEALLSAAQAASAKAEAAQSRTEMTEHERAVHALRVDFARQLEDLRSELKRMSADGASTITSSGEGVEFFTIPEDHFDGMEAGDPTASGLSPAQRQKLVVHGVAKVSLTVSGAVHALNLARLLEATREFAARRSMANQGGHFPTDLVGDQYFTTEASTYLWNLARVRSRSGPHAKPMPVGSAAWYAWLRTYLAETGPDVGVTLGEIPPFYVAADPSRLKSADVIDGVGMYLENVATALMSANAESREKPTTRGLVVKAALGALPYPLAHRVRTTYEMGDAQSSVPRTLTWWRFREDILTALEVLLTEPTTLADTASVLRSFAVPKKTAKEKEKEKADGKKDGKDGREAEVTCFSCGKKGHRSPECRSKGLKGGGAGAGAYRPPHSQQSHKAPAAAPVVMEEWVEEPTVAAATQEKEGKATAGTRPPWPKSCYNCRDPGHKLRDCDKPTICHRCRTSGHMAKDCPLGEKH